ncbi:MAG: lipid A deacylase LpxR family protein [Cytophagaceae bacterium]|nr:lipid A deacylase LpxR family protein [Cytophagaceae bacterium]
MWKIKLCFCWLCCLLPVLSLAQRIDNTASYRDLGGEKYIRLHYDNDFFTASDFYYTQGYSFEVVHPALKKNPLSKALLRLKGGTTKYGLAFEHFGFTPTNIGRSEILYNDRPFASCILLKSFAISVDTVRRTRLSAVLSTGGIGPVAFGEGMQKTIHRWINGVEPLGWRNQIQNDVLINYELNHEKLLYQNRFFSLNTNAQVRVGTLNDKAQVGFTLMAGKFNSPFGPVVLARKNRFQLYIYNQPLVSFVAYDATLQGGLFNRSSPYTLRSSEINRVTFQNNVGIVLKTKKIYLEYYQSLLTREFKTGMPHRWGGFRIGVGI